MKTKVLLFAVTVYASQAWAAGYAEKKLGDLSDDGLAPTVVRLKPGSSNAIAGKFGTVLKPDGTHTDRDYFTIHLAEGETLEAIILSSPGDVGGAASFIGVQSGEQVTVPPVGGSPADLLGWANFDGLDVGRDILPDIGAGVGAIGFTPPLRAGTYSFWVEDLSMCKCRYRLNFFMLAPAH
jgi:hypothetical protein